MKEIKFLLTDKQYSKLEKWHRRCNIDVGTIGGRKTYEITPVGLGIIFKVKCACGKELDLTDTNIW